MRWLTGCPRCPPSRCARRWPRCCGSGTGGPPETTCPRTDRRRHRDGDPPDPRVAPRRERHDTRRDRPLAGAAGAWHGEAEPAGAPGGAAADGVGGGWRHGRLGHRRRPRISVRRMTMEWSRYRKAAVAAATAVVEIVALWQDAPQWALAAAALAGAVLVYAVPNRLAEERRR